MFERRDDLEGTGEGVVEYLGSVAAEVTNLRVAAQPPDTADLFIGESATLQDLKKQFGKVAVTGSADLTLESDVVEVFRQGQIDPRLRLKASISWAGGPEEKVTIVKPRFHVGPLVPGPKGKFTLKDVEFDALVE